jgi:ketosteroid isomerase-like protein
MGHTVIPLPPAGRPGFHSFFTDIQTTVITADTALVFARFHNVAKADNAYATGLTTLLCQKIDGRWVIVHDHSSGLPADTPPKAPQR